MTLAERRKYLRRMRDRYWAADRRGRGGLLTEMALVTGLHRRSLVRLLAVPQASASASASARDPLVRRRRTVQRGRTYGQLVDGVLRVVWESLDYLCAERLTPALLAMARHLAHHGEMSLTPEVAAQLAQMSRATVQRRLTHFHHLGQYGEPPPLPRRGPERANRTTALARQIPLGRIAWDEVEPGHFEVDLVHHNGGDSGGIYVHTLQLVDVATGWSERVAVLGRGQAAMEAGFRRVLARLPFPIRHLHPDNGSEFLNDHLVRFWGEHITGLTLSRSRPWKKNDNRFVEQKNDTLVRAYLGHVRLDTATQCDALNALYDDLWRFYNLFQPVLHLVAKQVHPVTGRLKRAWDQAATPLDRLATAIVEDDAPCVTRGAAVVALLAQREDTNPRLLRRAIYRARARLLGTTTPVTTLLPTSTSSPSPTPVLAA